MRGRGGWRCGGGTDRCCDMARALRRISVRQERGRDSNGIVCYAGTRMAWCPSPHRDGGIPHRASLPRASKARRLRRSPAVCKESTWRRRRRRDQGGITVALFLSGAWTRNSPGPSQLDLPAELRVRHRQCGKLKGRGGPLMSM